MAMAVASIVVVGVGVGVVLDMEDEFVMAKKLTRAKAKKILKEGKIGGKPLTKKQKGFFGARAGGAPVRRKKK